MYHRCVAVLGLVGALLFHAGCSTPSSDPAKVRVWTGEDRQLHVAVPGAGFDLRVEGRQPFSARLEDGFDLMGEVVGGEGRTVELVLEINTNRPLQLEISGIAQVKVQTDGQPTEQNAEIPTGKHKVVVTGKLP